MLPHVVIHNEMSLDARMDGLDVDMGRFYTLAGTWHEDCTLVGSETLLAGMPELGDAAEPVALEPGDAGPSGGGSVAGRPAARRGRLARAAARAEPAARPAVLAGRRSRSAPGARRRRISNC